MNDTVREQVKNGETWLYNYLGFYVDVFLVFLGFQDDLIGQLQVGVGKLHERAVTINNETTLHSQLLDNLDAGKS